MYVVTQLEDFPNPDEKISLRVLSEPASRFTANLAVAPATMTATNVETPPIKDPNCAALGENIQPQISLQFMLFFPSDLSEDLSDDLPAIGGRICIQQLL